MSKHGRQITDEKKPSVFERLGVKSVSIGGRNVCQNWAEFGVCPLNTNCKYADTHIVSKHLKKKTEMSPKQLIKKHGKKMKTHHSPDVDLEKWGLGDLEEADEKALERRRLELQRELQLQLRKERETVTKKKKRKKSRSSSSSSSSSSDSSSSTSSSSSSSEPKKNRKRRRASSSDSNESPKTKRKLDKSIDKKKSYLTEHKKPLTVSKKVAPSRVQHHKKSISPKPKAFQKNTTQKSPQHWNDLANKDKLKNKIRGLSPRKKEETPKKDFRKTQNIKDRRFSPNKLKGTPVKSTRISPSRSKRNEISGGGDRKHSPRREKSKDKDKRKDIRRGKSSEEDGGGLKKGGKILPLKGSLYSKEINKNDRRQRSIEKKIENKRDNERDRKLQPKDKDKIREKEKPKERKTPEKRLPSRDNRPVNRGREVDRTREREAERERIYKEREAERQRERDEALERCRERQRERDRERERIERERREKEEERKRRERELPSLLSIKADPPHIDEKNDKHRDRRPRTPEHDRGGGGGRRNDDYDRRREDPGRRNIVDNRRDDRRGWEDNRINHERRRPGDDRNRRIGDDYEQQIKDDDYNDDRRGRKPPRPYGREEDDNWNQDVESDYADHGDWAHSDRPRDWNPRYERNWNENEEGRADWGNYGPPRRGGNDKWKSEWTGPGKNEVLPPVEPEPLVSVEKIIETELPPKETEQSWNDSVNKGDAITENLEEVLSDISDDPDEILNQEFDANEPQPFVEEFSTSTDPPLNGTLPYNNPSSNDIFFDQKRPLFEVLGERSLDFEEISDEELEEEARLNRGIVDVLGADWAALVEQTRPKRQEIQGSARRHWQLHNIIDRIGISVKYAGQEFVDKLLEKYKNVKEEPDEVKSEKTEKCENDGAGAEEIKKETEEIKIEAEDIKKEAEEIKEEAKVNEGIKLFHSIPSLHVGIKERESNRRSLFLSCHRYKRALSARSDLALRRELCNLPATEPFHYGANLDPKLVEDSIKLYQRSL